MKTKACRVQVKAVGTEDGLKDGEFTALVSVFDNVDTYGDKVVAGAFSDDLKAWEDSGDPIPVVWSHRWDDPFSHIGRVLKAEETADGLMVHAVVDDLDVNPTAQQVHRLLKGRRVTQFSFAYDVQEGAWVKSETDGEFYELRKLKLHEVGPCLVGVNQATELLAAKAHDLATKAGRVLSQKNRDTIVAARDALDEVLKAADNEDEKSATMEPSGDATPDDTNTQTSQPEGGEGRKAEAGDDGTSPTTSETAHAGRSAKVKWDQLVLGYTNI